jgi:hypothetical protein
MNQRLERTKVLEPCLKLCKQLLGTHILQYRRLDALDSYHVSGSPDIEIWIPKDNLVYIIMAECKKPEGGIFSIKQKQYRDKYLKYKNVLYEGITDVKELKNIILNISDYGCELLQEFKDLIL